MVPLDSIPKDNNTLLTDKMSFSSLSLDALQTFRAAIDAEIVNRTFKAEPAKAEVKAEVKAEPKVPREPGVAASWLSHVIKEHASDYAAFKAGAENKRGVALLFAKHWRSSHAEEYTLFEADFKKAAPAHAEAPAPSPVIPQPQPVKARKPWSAEAKAAAAAKRAAKKAVPQ